MHGTRVGDDEDPVELGLPSLLVIPHVKNSKSLFDDPTSYFRDCPGIEGMISRRTQNRNTAGPTHVVN